MSNGPAYLTKEGYEKLEKELEQLRKVKRQEVAVRLREAMEAGELIENAEYEAAKNEQAFVEGRILELDRLLATAQVIERSKKSDIVEVGSTVVVKEGNRKPETYTIVGAAEANPKQGLISNESPLGEALLRKRVGDIAEFEAPDGDLRFRIVKVK